jgi:hypothetical protein
MKTIHAVLLASAPRLPAFSIGDVNPPYWFFSNGSDLAVADNAVLSTDGLSGIRGI